MKKNIISHVSDGAMVLGIVVGGYALAKIYLLRSSLPTGVCPVNTYQPLLYAAIIMLSISFILSFVKTK